MKRIVLVLLAMSLPLAAQTQLPPAATQKVDYEKDVKPLLAQNCYGCHGDAVQQSGLRLDLRQNALRGGDYGPVIIPGKSAESKLIKRVVDGDGGLQMPPTGPLTDDEIGILRAWIDQGAEFRTSIAEAPPKPIDPKVAAAVTAVRSEPRRVIEQLIAGDREIVKAHDLAGSTLLHHAAGFGTIETMALLLDSGADVNAKNRRGSTPLHWAMHDEAKVRLLIDSKADVNVQNGAGETALMFAASNGNPKAVALLLDRGADARVRTKRNETALGNAGTAGVEETVRLLLDHGAEVNIRNIRGFSPLMLAASSEVMPAGVVKLLLSKGADTSYTADYDETARDLAAKRGDNEVARLLGVSSHKPTEPAAAISPVVNLQAGSIPDAVEKALRLLEKQSFNF